MSFDEDIKIYNKSNDKDTSDFDDLKSSINENTANGNIEKAKKLGIELALIKPGTGVLNISLNKSDISSARLYQMRVLFDFICEITIPQKIEDSMIVDVIKNSMYEYLEDNENGYYKNISDGAAFSFYRIALTKSGSLRDNIGTEFAMLCSEKNNEDCKLSGCEIYDKSLAYIDELIKKYSFA